MAKLYNILIILFFCLPCLAQEQSHHGVNFGGINEFDDPIKIDDNDATKAVNVLTDEGDLRSIYGNKLSAIIASSSITFQAEYIDTSGGHSLISKSGLGLYETDAAGSTSLIKTFDTEREVDSVSAFDRIYFTDGIESFYYDGASTAAASNMAACDYVEFWKNRLVCANIAGDTSRVNFSWYDSPSTWTVTADSTSGAIKYFDKNDGWQITCLAKTPYGLFIGKDRSTYLMTGYDNPTFYQSSISDTVGCSDDRSIQMVGDDLVWLSQDGVYAYDGQSVRLISREIKKTTDDIRVSNSSEYNWTVDTQAGWETGSGASWETDIDADVLKLELSNVTKTYLSTMDFAGEGGETATTSWSRGSPSTLDKYWGDKSIRFYGMSTLEDFGVYKASDNTLISSMTIGYAYGRGVWTLCDLNVSTNVSVYMKLTWDAGTKISSTTVYSGLKGGHLAIRDKGSDIYIDHPEAVAGSTLTSQNYDSGFTTPNYESFTTSGTDITVRFYTSSDNVTFSSVTFPLSDSERLRYWKYDVLYSSSSPESPFNYATLVIKSTQPYYSEVKSIDDDITWGSIIFSEDFSDTGLINYHIRSASYAFASDAATPAWTSQTNNDTIAVSTNVYLQYKITPNDSVVSTSSVKINSSVASWIVGSVAPRVDSVVADNRYILAVSTNSSTANHLNLIWQRNKKWVFNQDVNYGTLTLFNDIPIAGDATTGSKMWKIMQDDVYTFDGTAINSTWETKDFTFALNKHKVFNRLWITADDSTTSDFEVAYQADRDGVWNSTSTSISSGNLTIKEVEGLFDGYKTVRTSRFRFTNNEKGSVFRLILFSTYFTINELIK